MLLTISSFSVTRLWIAYHNIKAEECELELELHRRHGPGQRIICSRPGFMLMFKVLRITPTLLLVSDARFLPQIYGRSNKSNHYITGSFGETESLFNMKDHRVHAHFRKIAAVRYSNMETIVLYA